LVLNLRIVSARAVPRADPDLWLEPVNRDLADDQTGLVGAHGELFFLPR